MHKSVDRILISHVGSLPRGDELGDMLIEDEAGRSVDKRRLEELIEDRVAHVLTKQREVGVDIANDGEQGRVGFQTYVPQRMSGFGGASKRPYAKEFIEFPLFTKKMLSRIPRTGKVFDAPEAVDKPDCPEYEKSGIRSRGSGSRTARTAPSGGGKSARQPRQTRV
jgi:5-methyltetrahydropteroyltriglutamate--homocysteine methyltransferase